MQRLEQDFKLTLQQQSSLDQWARWLDDVVTQALKQHAGSPSFPKAARQFLLKWSFYRWVSLIAARGEARGIICLQCPPLRASSWWQAPWARPEALWPSSRGWASAARHHHGASWRNTVACAPGTGTQGWSWPLAGPSWA